MDLTQESFDRLLGWLHPDLEEAGRIYEKIRTELIRRFQDHGCLVPEQRADDTIDRVAKKLPDIIETYVGSREPYFYRVGYYLLLEYFGKMNREVEFTEDFMSPEPSEDVEREFQCLEQCLKRLPTRKRELIEEYYQGDKAKKKLVRRELARSLNLELPALRLQAQRIRVGLKTCIIECLLA